MLYVSIPDKDSRNSSSPEARRRAVDPRAGRVREGVQLSLCYLSRLYYFHKPSISLVDGLFLCYPWCLSHFSPSPLISLPLSSSRCHNVRSVPVLLALHHHVNTFEDLRRHHGTLRFSVLRLFQILDVPCFRSISFGIRVEMSAGFHRPKCMWRMPNMRKIDKLIMVFCVISVCLPVRRSSKAYCGRMIRNKGDSRVVSDGLFC